MLHGGQLFKAGVFVASLNNFIKFSKFRFFSYLDSIVDNIISLFYLYSVSYVFQGTKRKLSCLKTENTFSICSTKR